VTFFKNLFLILVSNPDKTFLEKEDLHAHLSDEELVKQIVADNDPMLFGKLYDRYVKMVYNKCYGFAKSADEAEDLTQDVFLQLFIKLRTFKGKSKFSTWLYSFTYNFCVNYVNRNKQLKIRDKSVQVENTEHKLTEEVPDESLFEMLLRYFSYSGGFWPLLIMDAGHRTRLLIAWLLGKEVVTTPNDKKVTRWNL